MSSLAQSLSLFSLSLSLSLSILLNSLVDNELKVIQIARIEVDS